MVLYSQAGGGGLNEKGPNKLICLNIWPSVGGIVWEELEDVALFEEGVTGSGLEV